jgi:aspartate racemase
MKTVGVLGGLGPQATMDFEARFHRVSQALIPPLFSTGYPPLVVLYFRRLPVRVDQAARRPIEPFEIEAGLLEAAQSLGPLVDFLVVPSNTPHLFRAEIEAAAGKPLLSMIDRVVEEVSRRGWRRVGVMGFSNPTVYTTPLAARGSHCEILAPALRDALDQGILALMEGRESDAHRALAAEVLESLRARSVDGVVLGCSEIPLLLRERSEGPDLVNPVQLLAEAAVREAMRESD